MLQMQPKKKKNSVDEFNSRMEMTEERVGQHDDRTEMIQYKEQKEERLQKQTNKQTKHFRDIWKNIKMSNICVTKVPEGEKKMTGAEKKYLKSNIHKSPKFGGGYKFIDSRGSAQPKQDKLKTTTTTTKNPTKNHGRHILTKLLRTRDKEKNLGSSRHGAAEMSQTRNHEVVDWIPGLTQWVKDPVLL